MNSEPPNNPGPSVADLQDAYKTVVGFREENDHLCMRLEKVSDLISKATSLPSGPVLVWEERGGLSDTRQSATNSSLAAIRARED
jgi:hypothetical protein